MNCTQIERLIPLYSGGDLPPRQAETVREHLRSCARCEHTAAEYEESRDWLRGLEPPQLDDPVFDDLREAVHHEIARAQTRSSFFELLVPQQFAIAASAALVLFIIVVVVYLNSHQSLTNPSPVTQQGKDLEDPGGARPRSGDIVNKVPIRRRVERSSRGTHAKYTLPYYSSPALETIALMTEPPGLHNDIMEIEIDEEPAVKQDVEMLRIEIQTADPNIRIIWLGLKDTSNSMTR